MSVPASGWVFNIQRFSVHDGPGVRTTVFLKGCPLRCPWCHNPEGLERRAQLRLRAHACTRCGRCQVVCPHGVPTVTPTGRTWEPTRCTACGRCVAACPAGALEVVGRRLSVGEVMEVVRRDRPFYTDSGGMTVSGGEPLAQGAFTQALLKAAHAEGIHTTVETSATAPWEQLELLLPWVGLWLVDVKHTDAARHRELTGVCNTHVLPNVRHLLEAGAALTMRLPFVPQYNAEESFLTGLVAFLGSLPTPPPVELMPYHRLGQGKWADLGGTAPMPENLLTTTAEDMRRWIEALAAAGVTVIVP